MVPQPGTAAYLHKHRAEMTILMAVHKKAWLYNGSKCSSTIPSCCRKGNL